MWLVLRVTYDVVMDTSGSADPRWVWYGGRPCVDFVNTRRRRHAEPVEYLSEPADLAAWAAALVDAPGRADAALLREALGLREAIDALVLAAVADTAPRAADVKQINA